jgi:membrane-bound lytic murein transglycosylase B
MTNFPMVRAWLGGALAAVVLACSAGAALAEPAQDFSTWLGGVRSEAEGKGIHKETLDAALDGIQPIDRVLELDRKQPEFTLTFDAYLSHVVSDQRVARGHQMMAENRKLLKAVAKKYGVPSRVIAAMWGVETDFGRVTGGFNIIPALATLAYDGRRSQYFRGELFNALTIIDHGQARPEALRGSWAGAMGQCQFMPSTYLHYAVAWDGQGHPDIWTNPGDVFASTANYLSSIGWKAGEGWGMPVRLPKRGIAEALVSLDVKHSFKQWNKLGLRLANGKPLPNLSREASLIRAETGKGEDVGHGQPYLVSDNFRVFMKWNRSVFFALGAGTLADRLGNR